MWLARTARSVGAQRAGAPPRCYARQLAQAAHFKLTKAGPVPVAVGNAAPEQATQEPEVRQLSDHSPAIRPGHPLGRSLPGSGALDAEHGPMTAPIDYSADNKLRRWAPVRQSPKWRACSAPRESLAYRRCTCPSVRALVEGRRGVG